MDTVSTKLAADSTLAAGAMTLPVWEHFLRDGINEVYAVGGLILLALRIIIALRDLRNKKSKTDV